MVLLQNLRRVEKETAGEGKELLILHQNISICMPEHTKLKIGRNLLHAAVLSWMLSGKQLWIRMSEEAGNTIVCT